MNDGKVYLGSAGTQTAGLGLRIENPAGPPYRSNQTEEYNGTWSEQNDLSNRRGQGVGTGLQTAAMFSTEMVAHRIIQLT